MMMFRATKLMWRRHPGLMAASSAIEVMLAGVVFWATGSIAWAASAMVCVIIVATFLTFRIEKGRGTIREYVEQIRGK